MLTPVKILQIRLTTKNVDENLGGGRRGGQLPRPLQAGGDRQQEGRPVRDAPLRRIVLRAWEPRLERLQDGKVQGALASLHFG